MTATKPGMLHLGTGSIKVDNGVINIGTAAIISGTSLQVENGDVKLINGKLIIGAVPSTPGGYSIYAKNGILTERVKVAIASTSDWSDFVFNKDYPLLSLPQLNKYIIQNGHLPAVPSAQDVVCNGIDVGKMDATLLQKIEELTLYSIQLYQNNETLQKQIQDLQVQINSLKK